MFGINSHFPFQYRPLLSYFTTIFGWLLCYFFFRSPSAVHSRVQCDRTISAVSGRFFKFRKMWWCVTFDWILDSDWLTDTDKIHSRQQKKEATNRNRDTCPVRVLLVECAKWQRSSSCLITWWCRRCTPHTSDLTSVDLEAVTAVITLSQPITNIWTHVTRVIEVTIQIELP